MIVYANPPYELLKLVMQVGDSLWLMHLWLIYAFCKFCISYLATRRSISANTFSTIKTIKFLLNSLITDNSLITIKYLLNSSIHKEYWVFIFTHFVLLTSFIFPRDVIVYKVNNVPGVITFQGRIQDSNIPGRNTARHPQIPLSQSIPEHPNNLSRLKRIFLRRSELWFNLLDLRRS